MYNIGDLHVDMPFIQLKGQILRFEEKGHKKSKRLVAHFKDDTGSLELVWFKGIRWIRSSLKLHTDYIVFGKPSNYKEDLILYILILIFKIQNLHCHPFTTSLSFN